MTRSPLTSARPPQPPPGSGGEETPEQAIARLSARVKQLEAEATKLTTEREILRQAAKYVAGERNW